ncbi:unnamed protein product [Gordionus sp. m RMFG-2023]
MYIYIYIESSPLTIGLTVPKFLTYEEDSLHRSKRSTLNDITIKLSKSINPLKTTKPNRIMKYDINNYEEGSIYQTDLNHNLHSYSSLRRSKPLGFRNENHLKLLKQQEKHIRYQNHPKSRNVHIKIFNESFNINLKRNDKLLGPNFIYTIRNGTHVKNLPIRVPSCYYRGFIFKNNTVNSLNKLNEKISDTYEDTSSTSLAALSTCRGELV